MCFRNPDQSDQDNEGRAARKAADESLKQAKDLERHRAGKTFSYKSSKSLDTIRSQAIKKAVAVRDQSAQGS